MKNKKAFEVQFNWFFVLIAGAAILVIVSFIIFKQKNISESSSNSVALRSIESVISGTSVSTDTSSVIEVPDLSIQVDCGKISIGKISKQYPRLVLFAPFVIKGNKIIAQTLSFNAPYKSSNILLMTSQNVRYILIGNSDLIKTINKTLPPDINKENFSSYNAVKIKNSNNYKVRFVFDNFAGNLESASNFPPLLSKMPGGDVTALNIIEDSSKDKGKIEFYENNGNSFKKKGNSHYLGKSSLIAAVYSDTPEHYECNMKNVFAKHELVTQVYSQRINNLNGISSISADCKNNAYTAALPILSSIQTSSNKLSKSISESERNNLANAAESLKTQNKEAQKFSCPMIY